MVPAVLLDQMKLKCHRENRETPPHAVSSLWSCCFEDLSSSCPDWETEERETDSGLGPVSYAVIMAPGKHLRVLPI